MGRRTLLGSLVGIFATIGMVVACSSLPDLHFVDSEGGVGSEGGVIGEGGAFNCRSPSFVCQDAVPEWTPVLFAASMQPSCPFGTTGTDLKVASGDASATCACSCSSAGGSCGTGSFTVASGADSTCTGGATTTVPVDSPGCTAINGGSVSVSSHAMATPPMGPTSCTPTPGQAAALTSGRLCTVAGDGTGCSSTQSCAPKTFGGGFQTCVAKSGINECPFGFAKRSTAGTSAVDNRTCTGCACGAPTPCTGGSVSFYDSFMCKIVGNQHGAEGINGSCNPLSPDSSFTATHFKAQPPTGGGCGAPTNQGTAAGSVAFQNVQTICCR